MHLVGIYMTSNASRWFYYKNSDGYYSSQFPFTSYIYVLLQYIVLLQIPLRYYTINGLLDHHLRTSISYVAYQSPSLGNLTVNLSPILRICNTNNILAILLYIVNCFVNVILQICKDNISSISFIIECMAIAI